MNDKYIPTENNISILYKGNYDITLTAQIVPFVEDLVGQLRFKANACGDETKESRARKGAYVDCIVMVKEAMESYLNPSIFQDGSMPEEEKK